MRPRFLLDENLSPAIRAGLLRLNGNIKIVMIGDENVLPRGARDPLILLWAEKNNYIFVTGDKQSMQQHLVTHYGAGHYLPGLIWVRQGMGIGKIIEDLFLIWHVATHTEFRNSIHEIPL